MHFQDGRLVRGPKPVAPPPRVKCPFCEQYFQQEPDSRYTTGGIIVMLLGLITLPAYGLGVVFLIISQFLREKYYECPQCQKRF